MQAAEIAAIELALQPCLFKTEDSIMKSNKVALTLEVLEDRLAPNGAFGGAINAAPASNIPFPFNGLTVQTTSGPLNRSGFHGDFAGFGQLVLVPAPSPQSQLQSIQNQFQSFQATQISMMNQFLNEVQPLLQSWQLLSPFVVF